MAAITCGKCQDTHASVAEVRRCYEPKEAKLTDGYYKCGDDIYKVQYNRAGTNLYAKLLVIEPSEEGALTGRFDYIPGAIKKLKASMLLSKDEAAKFGQLYGVCFCGLLLTAEESIERGFGPVCGKKMGWI